MSARIADHAMAEPIKGAFRALDVATDLLLVVAFLVIVAGWLQYGPWVN